MCLKSNFAQPFTMVQKMSFESHKFNKKIENLKKEIWKSKFNEKVKLIKLAKKKTTKLLIKSSYFQLS